MGLVPEPQLANLHDSRGLDDPGLSRRFVDYRVAHHRPARRRVRRGEDLAVLREPRPRRYLASIGCAIPGVRRRERCAAQGDVAAAAGAPAGGSGDVRRPVERGVAPGGRGGRRRTRPRLVSRGSGFRAVPSRRGRVRRAGAGWARGRAAEREGVGRGCGGRDAVGGVVPGGRARGSAGRVHRSAPAARSPRQPPLFQCNNDCYACRAGSGVAGDALIVSRGSAAGASPRRRPELVPRSRAALLKASRGRGVKAARHSQIFKISASAVQPTTKRVFCPREPRDGLETHNPAHRKVRLRRRDVGAVVAHQEVRPEPSSRHPDPFPIPVSDWLVRPPIPR